MQSLEIDGVKKLKAARLILAIGLGFVFVYFGVDKFWHPAVWIGWVEVMDNVLGASKEIWLQIFGLIEVGIGIGLVIGLKQAQKFFAVLAALHLIGVLTQTGWNEIAIRDIALLLMSVAIFLLASITIEVSSSRSA